MPHIAITGDLGSGKSTVAKMLCEKLGYEYLSTGNIQRAMAAQQGLNTLEFNYLAMTNKSIDEKIDNYLKEINKQERLHVLDSRLAWHFVPRSFKIFTTVQPAVAARRVQGDAKRTSEGKAESISQKSKELLERQEAENNRFKDIYHADCRNLDNYHLIVDTSFHTAEEIACFIAESYRLFCEKSPPLKYWASPKLFFPTQLFTEEIIHSKEENGSPVEVCESRRRLLISRGHAALAEALRSNEFIPYKIVNGDLPFNASVLKSWENQFRLEYAVTE